jgi:hypothetical protein
METIPVGASGITGAAITMWAQQQRQPSPEPPSLESGVLWLEKMQESGEMSSQAKISVPAISRTTSVTIRRSVDQWAIEIAFIMMT